MASNLSTIGFDDTNPDDLEQVLLRLAQSGTARLTTPVGDYAIWRSRTGAEIWFHLSPSESDDETSEREIVGLTPFFEGSSDVPLNVTEIVKRPNDNMMEGAFHAWVAPNNEGEGAYPIVFDAVDMSAVSHRSLPEVWRARICGFAREIAVFADEAAFLSSQEDEPKVASRSVFPVGLFAAASQASGNGSTHSPAPTSHALIVGEVLAFEEFENEETGGKFLWMSVKSLAATYDIVATPDIVDGEVRVGAIVSTGCWLFGRAIT